MSMAKGGKLSFDTASLRAGSRLSMTASEWTRTRLKTVFSKSARIVA